MILTLPRELLLHRSGQLSAREATSEQNTCDSIGIYMQFLEGDSHEGSWSIRGSIIVYGRLDVPFHSFPSIGRLRSQWESSNDDKPIDVQ
jgi:hypothetical protein